MSDKHRECYDCGTVDLSHSFEVCDEGHLLCGNCWEEHTAPWKEESK